MRVLAEKKNIIFNKAFLQRNEASLGAEFLCKKALLNIMFFFCAKTLIIYVCHCLLNISLLGELFSVSVSGVNCDVHYWIFKNIISIKITISARLHLFCFSYHCYQ